MSNVKELTWIGHTSYAQPDGKGEYPGAVCKTFWSIWTYNRFFEKHGHLLVIDVTYQSYLLFLTKVIVMMTNQLNPDELDDFQEVSREVEFKMAERRKAKQEAKEKQARDLATVTAERARLAIVGEKYEARVKHMRALDPSSQERKELEKALNRGDPEVLGLSNKQDSAAYHGGKNE